jgi:glycosyltransferase involved in cell wall biosynthesis
MRMQNGDLPDVKATDAGTSVRPVLCVVFYANPDRYPPTINAITILREHFTVYVLCRMHDAAEYPWPADVVVERIGSEGSVEGKMRESAVQKLREFAAFTWTVRRRLQELEPAVVYAYEPHALYATALHLPASRILIYHRHEVEEHADLPFLSLQSWVMRRALNMTRRADLVVFPEAHRARYYLEMAKDPRPWMLVPNTPCLKCFADDGIQAPLSEQRWQRREFLFRGYLDPANGNLEPVRALSCLPFPALLRFLGPVSTGFRAVLEDAAHSGGVAERVRFDGYLPYLKANAAMLSASCGIALHHPVSMNLRFLGSASNKVFEYAACGLPVVVPNRASYRDFFGCEEWVRFADPMDIRSIASAMADVFSDRDRYAAMCLAAREAFETRYNYEAVFQPVLEKILALSGAPSS